ncbi:MAG: hypothetical protein KBT27_10345 [Prevotellaceae bacterium]|nr:hypothetical protein [Candidatus Faecinaster equi]MBQ0153352.1 hypothetical protein [Candidatus Colicola equi]
MSTIRDLIRNLLPYFVVKGIQQKRRDRRSFLNGYLSYVTSTKHISLKNESGFDNIISVQGFGYSGSGAVLDLLREYDNMSVVGHVDKEGSVTKDVTIDYEVDFIRIAGGLLEVEKYLDSHNLFHNDALLHRVALMIQNLQIYREVRESRPFFYEFFSQICTIGGALSPRLQYYNTHLKHDSKLILYLKRMTNDDYHLLCRRLINSILSLYQGPAHKKNIVLDQLFSDMEFDMHREMSYIPNLKTIVVYRDPRDIFCFAREKDVEWIPHSDVDLFIEWYQQMIDNYSVGESKLYYSVRFEDLIFSYRKTIIGIENYLGVDSSMHINSYKCFNPEYSALNVGMWKSDIQNIKQYQKIAIELETLCYH